MSKTKIVTVKNLEPGQEVALANCVTTGRVIKRVAKNLYLVAWQNREIEMPRAHLGVRVGNRWMFGPHNAP